MKKPPILGRPRVKFLRLWHRRWIRIPVLLAVLGIFAWGAFWAKGKLERRQGWKLATMADQSLREGKVDEARMGVQAALRLDPSNPVALRILSRLRLAEGARVEALDAFRRLLESGKMDFNDYTAYAILAAKEGDMALAERLVDAASRGGNAKMRSLLRAQIAAVKNNDEAVEKELREAVAVDEVGEAKLLLARHLASKGLNAQSAGEVLELLRQVSAKPDRIGADALTAGLTTGVVPITEADGWIVALRQHPAVTTSQWLLTEAVEIQLRPQTKTEVLQRSANRLRGKPLAERVEGMALAMRMGEPGLASGLLEPSEAVGDARVFSMWLDALALQNRWSEVSQALAMENQPLPPFLRGLYSGRALIAQGKVSEGRLAYGTALEAAFPKRQDFLLAIAYLGRVGQNDLFEQGFRKALEDPGGRGEVMRMVVPAVAGQQDAARTRRVYEIAASLPGGGDDPVLRNDLDYLSLVLGQPVDLVMLEQRSRSNPRDFAFRATHAMGLLRAGDAKKALQELENCEPDVHVATLPPHHKAIVAAAMAGAGREKEALAVASSIPPWALSLQEAEFLVSRLPKKSAASESQPAPMQTPAPAKPTSKGKKSKD